MVVYLAFFYFIFFVFEVEGGGGCRDLSFLPCVDDVVLLNHVIEIIEFPASRSLDCMHLCFLNRDCVSYNLGPKNAVNQVCNLSNTDDVEFPDDLQPLPGAKYCAIKNKCSKKPCPKYTTCKPDFDHDSFKCLNKKSCAELKKIGADESGVYNISPVPGVDLEVFCDQETDRGGWTVIQKRVDGSVDFYRGWNDYKQGFGNKNGEYWLGLETIYKITASEDHELRVDMEKFDGTKAYAVYNTFKVGPESEKYKLALGSKKKGDADDTFRLNNGMMFSTRDQLNNLNCATDFEGAWWFYSSCGAVHLNGRHLSYASKFFFGISWSPFTLPQRPLKKAEMKIRAVSYQA